MRNQGVLKILVFSVVLAIAASSVAVYSAANLGIGEKEIDESGGKGVISLVPPPFIGVAGASGSAVASASEVSGMREGTNFLEEEGLEIPNKILANFENNIVAIWFETKNMTAEKTSETSYSKPYSMKITYTKLPYEERWNQSFGFELPSVSTI